MAWPYQKKIVQFSGQRCSMFVVCHVIIIIINRHCCCFGSEHAGFGYDSIIGIWDLFEESTGTDKGFKTTTHVIYFQT